MEIINFRQLLKNVTILHEFSKTIGYVGASVCAKTITFFAIQNCGKIIMLFDDQLHLGLCDSLNSFYCLVHVGKAFLDIFFVLLALERKKQAKTF